MFVAALTVLAACASPNEQTDATGRPTADMSTSAASSSATRLTGEDVELSRGTYAIDLTKLAGGGPAYPTVELTVPDGWQSFGGWAVGRVGEDVPPVAIQFWDVAEVYGDPCAWRGTETDPGLGVKGLVAALVAQPMREPSEPEPVTVDGAPGLYLEWSVPSDIAVDDSGFAECDDDGQGHLDFRSWTGSGWSTVRYHQGAGQIDRVWVLDVGGQRLVVDAFSMPSATNSDIQELLDVANSIRFERPSTGATSHLLPLSDPPA